MDLHSVTVYALNAVDDVQQVHIVPHGFAEHSTGVGEQDVPPVSPAIANAIFEAQGKRLRHLPMGETI